MTELERTALSDVAKDLRRAISALEYAQARIATFADEDTEPDAELLLLLAHLHEAQDEASRARGLVRVRMQKERGTRGPIS